MSEPMFESAVRGTSPAAHAAAPAPQAGLTDTATFSAAAQFAAEPQAPARALTAEVRTAAPHEEIVPVADIPEAPGWALALVAVALAAWFLRRHG